MFDADYSDKELNTISIFLTVGFLIITVLFIFGMTTSGKQKGVPHTSGYYTEEEIPAEYEIKIRNILRYNEYNQKDIYKDGVFDCKDSTIMFLITWHNFYATSSLRPVIVYNWNRNDNNMCHVFVRLGKYYIETMSTSNARFLMQDYWGKVYDPFWNDEDDTWCTKLTAIAEKNMR